MKTAVVSGRIDIDTKRRADAVIRAAGSTTGDVIKSIWRTIADTGTLPYAEESAKAADKKSRALHELRSICDSMPPCPHIAQLTDEGVKELLRLRHV